MQRLRWRKYLNMINSPSNARFSWQKSRWTGSASVSGGTHGARAMMLSDVCLSVAYIGTKSRTERPRKTKLGTEVAHVTRDSNTTFKVKMSRSQGRGHIVAASRPQPVELACHELILLSTHWLGAAPVATSGVFGGPCATLPPPWPGCRDYCSHFVIIFSAV